MLLVWPRTCSNVKANRRVQKRESMAKNDLEDLSLDTKLKVLTMQQQKTTF